MISINDAFKIGYITKTRGLKGEVQLFLEFEDYEELDLQEAVFIEIEKKLVPFFVTKAQVLQNSTAYLFLEDVDHIDKAKPLVKSSVYLSKDKLPVREEGTFYVSDLKGYIVHDKTYGALGEIIAINEYPQQDIAVVQYGPKELLFPIIDDFIVEIDEEKGLLEVDLPEGLVDVYGGELP